MTNQEQELNDRFNTGDLKEIYLNIPRNVHGVGRRMLRHYFIPEKERKVFRVMAETEFYSPRSEGMIQRTFLIYVPPVLGTKDPQPDAWHMSMVSDMYFPATDSPAKAAMRKAVLFTESMAREVDAKLEWIIGRITSAAENRLDISGCRLVVDPSRLMSDFLRMVASRKDDEAMEDYTSLLDFRVEHREGGMTRSLVFNTTSYGRTNCRTAEFTAEDPGSTRVLDVSRWVSLAKRLDDL